MCGIAGFMTRDGARPDANTLDRMIAAIAHRGPDGDGVYFNDNVALGHTRLAIIDLATGDQPLFADSPDSDAPLALVANGEIYNYIELTAEFGAHRLKTKSDCEIPLILYLDQGQDFADRLRGMYAIALHDPGNRRLVLSRDPFGIKPLYYCETEQGFAFSSEIGALLQASADAAGLSETRRDELLQLQFTTGRPSPFEGINRVLPGETIIVEDGRIVASRRLRALPRGGVRRQSEDAALKELDEVLEESVTLHQRSDVPYGMFLSGGIDSSTILAMMARLNDQPVRAFTVGFSGTAVQDERDHARELARITGALHHEVEFGANDFWSLLPEVVRFLDDPAADYATLPTFKLAKTAREHGVKVVLSGEGGDELFGGYGRYRRAMRPALLGGRAIRTKGALDGLDVLRDDSTAWRGGMEAASAAAPTGCTRLQRAQATDCEDWLPNNLLTKLDRMLMAHGVEGRVPLLDPGVADFAFRLPDQLKVKKGLGKWLLRLWLDKHLPEAQAFARKRGFTVPVGEWIASRGGELAPLVAQQEGVREACHDGAVEALFRSLTGRDTKHSRAAWHLLFFSLWHQRHILGEIREGDVCDLLSAR